MAPLVPSAMLFVPSVSGITHNPREYSTPDQVARGAQVLLDAGVKVSMDGKGRVFDNIFTERLWRSVKYEEVYLKGYEDGWEAQKGLGRYFAFYNTCRPHQALDYQTPEEVHRAEAA